MRKFTLIITFLAFHLANAQSKDVSQTELEEKVETYMVEYNESNNESESISLLKKAYEIYSLLASKFPESGRIGYYLYMKGTLSSDKEEKKNCYKKVIEMNHDKEYIRKAYINLCFYAIEEKDFNTAKQYLETIEKMEIPSSFTCGNEREVYYAQLKNLREAYETGIKK